MDMAGSLSQNFGIGGSAESTNRNPTVASPNSAVVQTPIRSCKNISGCQTKLGTLLSAAQSLDRLEHRWPLTRSAVTHETSTNSNNNNDEDEDDVESTISAVLEYQTLLDDYPSTGTPGIRGSTSACSSSSWCRAHSATSDHQPSFRHDLFSPQSLLFSGYCAPFPKSATPTTTWSDCHPAPFPRAMGSKEEASVRGSEAATGFDTGSTPTSLFSMEYGTASFLSQKTIPTAEILDLPRGAGAYRAADLDHVASSLFPEINSAHAETRGTKDSFDTNNLEGSSSLKSIDSSLQKCAATGNEAAPTSGKAGLCSSKVENQHRNENNHRWESAEDNLLKQAVELEGGMRVRWQIVSSKYFVGTRSAGQCKGRWKKASGVSYNVSQVST